MKTALRNHQVHFPLCELCVSFVILSLKMEHKEQ